MMSLAGWKGGSTSLQPYPLTEEILKSKGPDGTTTKERDDGTDGGPGGREEARSLHHLPARMLRREGYVDDPAPFSRGRASKLLRAAARV